VLEAGAQTNGFKAGDHVCFNLWGPGDQGALSEEVIVDAANCWHLPPALSFAEGAGFLVGYATAYHGLVHRANLQPGEWLVVTGASGGMGLAALQLGRVLGAQLIAVASDHAKLAEVGRIVGLPAERLVCLSPGAKELKERVGQITNGALADVVYENVGGEVFDACVRCMAPYGRLCVIGFAGGRIPSLPANLALVKGFSLVGVRAGAQLLLEKDKAAAMYAHLLQLAACGALRPAVHTRVPLERFADAFKALTTRSVVGKAIVEPVPSPTARL
jgi:NADPH2:quinone reductase